MVPDEEAFNRYFLTLTLFTTRWCTSVTFNHTSTWPASVLTFNLALTH